MNLIMTEQQWPLLQSLHCNIIQMDTIEAGRLSDSSPSSVSILFNRNRNCNRNTNAIAAVTLIFVTCCVLTASFPSNKGIYKTKSIVVLHGSRRLLID